MINHCKEMAYAGDFYKNEWRKIFMKKTKLVALGLAASLVLGGGTVGCGSKKTDTDASSAASSVVSTETAAETETDQTTEAEKEEPMHIVVGMMSNSNITDWKDNLLTKAIEEQFNVDLEFFMLPAANGDWVTKVSLMGTAEADNMPDMLTGDGVVPSSQQLELGAAGVFQPIEDYLDDPEKTPNWHNIPEETRNLMLEISMRQSDGHIYGFADSSYSIMTNNP